MDTPQLGPSEAGYGVGTPVSRHGVLPTGRAAATRPAWLRTERFLPALGVIAGLALVAVPLLTTVVRSLLRWDGGQAAVSLGNFAALFADPRFWTALGNTALCGAGATVGSCVLGFTLAWLVVRTDLPGRRSFELLNLIPFFLSPYVGAISWIYLAAPNSGLIEHAMQDWFGWHMSLPIYSLLGVTGVLTLFYTPYVYLFVLPPLRQMDAALEDAARVHGASFWYTLRHISIPLLSPALISSALVVFVTTAGLFDVPLALSSPGNVPSMPTEIYSAVQYPADFGRAAAFGVVVLAGTLLLTSVQRRFLANRRFDLISGKSYRPRILRLGRGGRAGGLLVEVLYLGAGVVLPTAALAAVALSRLWTGRFFPSRANLGNFDYVLFHYDLTKTAIGNSLFLALSGATIGVVLSLLQAYYLNRAPARRRGWADALLSIPLGIPGIVLGLGFLIAGIRTPLYGTLGLVLLAYVARFFPFATRTVSAMMLAINPELEASARASGATWLQTMWLVMLPLLRPALVAAWLMLFVIFVRELGATILLYTQGTETISVALVLLAERSPGYVAALAMIQLMLLMIAFAAFRVSGASLGQGREQQGHGQ
jgi:iron(III) transport system permease protein